jgi:iron complex outermembrane receptor protein
MLRFRIVLFLMAVFALFVLSATRAAAQPSTGKITGTVRDANGAPVVAAPVVVTNQTTGASRVVRTNEAGLFEAANLAPGAYTVSVEPQGFLKVTRKDVRVEAGSSATVDATLEVRISEEVTVTAMKRESTVHDTPFSIAAESQEDLQQKGIQTFEELAANTANVEVQNLGPGQSQVSIRGVSSGQIARDQPGPKEEVGTYLDESPISFLLFTPNIDLFDMNRIEILRGPQGTLFGSGSLSGTVRYISNMPVLNQTEFFGEVIGSSIEGGNQGGGVKAGFNAPLGSHAAARVAAYFDHFAGFMDAVQPDLSVDKNVNTGQRAGVRAAFEIAPTDQLSITPRFVYQNAQSDGWNRVDLYNILANPFTTTRPQVTLGDHELFTQIKEPMDDNFYLGDLNVAYNFGKMVLTSITSYNYRDILVVRDAGALTSSITIGLPQDVYTLNAPLDDATTAQGWTEEVRLSGGDERLQWVGGAFYAYTQKHYAQSLIVDGFTELSDIPSQGLRAANDELFYSNLTYKTRQYAFFTEGTYKFTPWFNFTAGLRYYNWKDEKRQIFDGIFAQDNTGTSLVENVGTTKSDGVAPRFIASFDVSPSTIINAQVSKGFRLGGINDPLNIPLCSDNDLVVFGNRPAFDDETLWNYEIDSKSRIFGGRGYVNASAFYMDINDLQTVVTAGQCSSRLVFSVPSARSIGGELEFGGVLNEHFDFSASVGYNDATLRSTVTAQDKNGNPVIVSGIRKGARLPSVPDWQAAIATTYQQPIAEGVQGYLTGTWQYIGSRYTQVGDDVPGFGVVPLVPIPPVDPTNGALPNTIGGPLTQDAFVFDPLLPAYNLLNFRLGARFSNFDVAFFVNNVTNETARLALDRERGLLARVGYLTNPPRTFGLNARTTF